MPKCEDHGQIYGEGCTCPQCDETSNEETPKEETPKEETPKSGDFLS